MADQRSPEDSSHSDIECTGGRCTTSGHESCVSVREQDRLLPIANVGRIMKQSLPPNAKISKEAKETMQECVSEFISFITGEASDKCLKERRKTINGDDLLCAMTTLGFEQYADSLKIYLYKYRDVEGEKASNMHPKQAAYQSLPAQLNSNYFDDPAFCAQHAVYGQIPHGPLAYGQNQQLIVGYKLPVPMPMNGTASATDWPRGHGR